MIRYTPPGWAGRSRCRCLVWGGCAPSETSSGRSSLRSASCCQLWPDWRQTCWRLRSWQHWLYNCNVIDKRAVYLNTLSLGNKIKAGLRVATAPLSYFGLAEHIRQKSSVNFLVIFLPDYPIWLDLNTWLCSGNVLRCVSEISYSFGELTKV